MGCDEPVEGGDALWLDEPLGDNALVEARWTIEGLNGVSG